MGAAVRAGIRVPDDLAVIGHDGSPLTSAFVPALSTTRFDTSALGRLFADLVLHQVENRLLPRREPPRDATPVRRASA